MNIQQLDARLAKDTSTTQSLFTGKFTGITSISLNLANNATGTANFAIFENGQQKVSNRVTAGGSVSWSPQASSVVEFYVNYYSDSDLPQAFANIS